ncbi:hypothetical protein [Myceligenerans pegani]|uniref:FAD-binding oxidoreductase n=1 Tax=Myceligenerans pegani TaxID=2776917 RepID=A0ABR9MU22_9MICO|nr:hypothetical protein [Myceligenerans sp. TRM 65318]MBE1874872.1 hypothetical protein [Myceligenerans sp. TRM 65318]MBE3017143.1 hypothetical protein [Myceligenerans sp. TRM 65318]
MSAVEAALAAAIDAVLTTPEVTYLRGDATHSARTEFGTRYDVVVPPVSLHVPAGPPRPPGAPAGATVLRGGADLDAPAG